MQAIWQIKLTNFLRHASQVKSEMNPIVHMKTNLHTSAAADNATLDPFSPSGQLDLFSGLSISGPSKNESNSLPGEDQQRNGEAEPALPNLQDGKPALTHGHNSGLDLLDLDPDADLSLAPLSNGMILLTAKQAKQLRPDNCMSCLLFYAHSRLQVDLCLCKGLSWRQTLVITY